MNQKTIDNFKKSFGKTANRSYTSEELEKISYYTKTELPKNKVIDDITWNDLDMTEIFRLVNNTPSSVGDEYLYSALRMPIYDEGLLKKRACASDSFMENENDAMKVYDCLSGIGKNRKNKTSVFEYISKIFDLKKQSNLIHFILIALLILSVISLFLVPGISILILLAMIFINVISYYKIKAKVDIYFNCFKYTVLLLKSAKRLSSHNISALDEYNKKIDEISGKLKSLSKGSWLVASGNVTTSAADVVMDYVRMLFHVDLIKFNSAQKCISNNAEDIKELYKTVGEIELILAISSFRKSLNCYCEPIFEGNDSKISFENIYHPLIKEAVKNSIDDEKMVLLTGSNASGKSTFLRTVAINVILAETLYTCTADKFKIPFTHVFSSMALSDNLSKNESYYIVEIKSIKRILDALGRNLNVICFVDEVLRGTNTIERIAASSRILKSMDKGNCICFAATHDIELTQILKSVFNNYHFEEEITDNDVKFSYRLKKGPATSRNAIKLLEVMGYDKAIVDEAKSLAEHFESSGIWS